MAALPEKVLVHIFSINTLQDSKRFHDPSKTTLLQSQVCRQWRTVARKYPKLWTSSIDFSKPLDYIRHIVLPLCGPTMQMGQSLMLPSLTQLLLMEQACLRATKRAPISKTLSDFEVTSLFLQLVKLPIKVDHFSDKLEEMSKFLLRTRSIMLRVPGHSWQHLERFFDNGISHLKQLVLLRGNGDNGHYNGNGSVQNLTVKSINEAAARAFARWNMTYLALSGCFLNLRSIAFGGLQTLVLECSTGYTPSALASVLEGMPGLRRLELINSIGIYNVTDLSLPPADARVKLEHLEWLYLDGMITPVSHALVWLDIPSQCTIRLVCRQTIFILGSTFGPPAYNTVVALSEMRLLIEARQLPSSSRQFNAMKVAVMRRGARILLESDPHSVDPAQLCSADAAKLSDKFQVIFMWNPQQVDSEALLGEICTTLPKHHGITCLTFNCPVIPVPYSPAGHVHRLKMLSYLECFEEVDCLDKITPQEFINLLCYFSYDFNTLRQAQRSSSHIPDPLKSLERLTFYQVDFSFEPGFYLLAKPFARSVNFAHILEAYMRRRRMESLVNTSDISGPRLLETGVTWIREIVLVQCKFTPFHILLFESHGAKVTVIP